MINIFIATIPQPFDIQGAAADFQNAFPNEKNRVYLDAILKKSNPASQTQSLCAILLLAHGLKEMSVYNTDLVLMKSESGKPGFEGETKIFYSISHDQNKIAVAISDINIGIDIQSVSGNTDQNRIATRFFHPSEAESVKCGDRDFLDLWTQKEALAKLLDIPLSACAKQPLPKELFFESFKFENTTVSVAAMTQTTISIIKFDQI